MKRIIVAEDEDQTRRSLATVLESAGFIVKQTKNGMEAMEELFGTNGSKHVDLLLTDIVMPIMTGLELIDTIRRKYMYLPIVVITGYRDDTLTDQLKRLNCQFLIDKPFEPDELLKCINDVFDQKKRIQNKAAFQ